MAASDRDGNGDRFDDLVEDVGHRIGLATACGGVALGDQAVAEHRSHQADTSSGMT